MRTTVDVEAFVNIALDDIASFEDFDHYLDYVAEEIGHPLLQNINTEPVAINEDKTIKIKVTGYVDVEEEEEDGENARPAKE